MWKLACDLGSRPKQGLVGDIKISKSRSLETLQRSHKLAPAKVKIVAKLRPCAKYDAQISSPPPLTYMFTSFGMSLLIRKYYRISPASAFIISTSFYYLLTGFCLWKNLFSIGWQRSPGLSWFGAGPCIRLQGEDRAGLGLHPWFCLIKEISIVSDIISTQSSSCEAIWPKESIE